MVRRFSPSTRKCAEWRMLVGDMLSLSALGRSILQAEVHDSLRLLHILEFQHLVHRADIRRPEVGNLQVQKDAGTRPRYRIAIVFVTPD